MSANGSLLFLLTHETQKREREIEAELKRSCPIRGAVVEAGPLTVRRMVATEATDMTCPTDYVRVLVGEHDTVSLRLVADLARAKRAECKVPDKKLGFVRHAWEFSIASAAILCGMCALGLVIAFCSFVIGVALPFHLLS